jgi:hypothetical protein
MVRSARITINHIKLSETMTLKQARARAKKAAQMYLHWAEYFNGATPPALEEYLTQVIYEAVCEERQACSRRIKRIIKKYRDRE